jgi:hypothetical protein
MDRSHLQYVIGMILGVCFLLVWIPILWRYDLSLSLPSRICGVRRTNTTNATRDMDNVTRSTVDHSTIEMVNSTEDNTTTDATPEMINGIVCSKVGVNLYQCDNEVYWNIDPKVPTDQLSSAPEILLCQVHGRDVLQCNQHRLHKIGSILTI